MMKTHTKKQRELRNTLIGWLLVMPSLIFYGSLYCMAGLSEHLAQSHKI